MDSTLITSLITTLAGSGVTLIGVILANGKSQAVMEEKIENLTEKVNKHNTIIERTYKLEQDVAVLTEKQKVANNRIDDLENK